MGVAPISVPVEAEASSYTEPKPISMHDQIRFYNAHTERYLPSLSRCRPRMENATSDAQSLQTVFTIPALKLSVFGETAEG